MLADIRARLDSVRWTPELTRQHRKSTFVIVVGRFPSGALQSPSIGSGGRYCPTPRYG